MANVRDVDDFVEQLSNCIGEISGDEVVFKKIPYSSECVVRMRNHNEKVANIWYDYDKDKIIVQLVPAFRNMEYSLDDLTIDTIKGIGQMVRKNALNRIGESMEFKEAKEILNKNGFILKEHSTGILIDELNKWNNLLNQMDKVKSHHYEIKGNTIVEYTKIGFDSVWTFEKNGENINVVVTWPNRPEWQEMEPVEFEYTLDKYEDYENDVNEFLTYTGKFH